MIICRNCSGNQVTLETDTDGDKVVICHQCQTMSHKEEFCEQIELTYEQEEKFIEIAKKELTKKGRADKTVYIIDPNYSSPVRVMFDQAAIDNSAWVDIVDISEVEIDIL